MTGAAARLRHPFRRPLAELIAAVLVAAVLPAQAADIPARISARPLAGFSTATPNKTRFGGLDFVGGFTISSNRREVGALSGLVITGAGRGLLAITDDGLMLKAAIVRDKAGRPTGLADAALRRMATTAGPLSPVKVKADTEGLDLYKGADGRTYAVVSFEQKPAVVTGPLGADGFIGPMAGVELPKETRRLQSNRGLESVAALPAGSGLPGRFLVIAEQAERKAGTDNPPGWVIGGKAPLAFRVKRSLDYDITDAKVGPDERLYLLERKFSFSEGIHCRIRVLSLKDIRAGAVIDGPTLFEASFAEEIDNMEGLSVWRTANGETRLSLISDDNRTFFQRTIYLEFRLARP